MIVPGGSDQVRKVDKHERREAGTRPGRAASGEVLTSQTTTSTSYSDLATVGPFATVDVGPSGKVLVIVAARVTSAAGFNSLMSFAGSGANTVPASDDRAIQLGASVSINIGTSMVFLLSGLNVGPTTFTAKYRVDGGTGTFFSRRIVVVPL